MKLQSALLASAALLAAASGARAADAIVAVEPQATNNYVEACDAFGKGYFYIPGTETCLDIGGYVRFQVETQDNNSWDVYSKGQLDIQAKTDTELGALTSRIAINAYAYSDGTSDNVELSQAYVGLGGFQAGYFKTYWDEDLTGEVDRLSGNTKMTEIRYGFIGSGFYGGLAVDALTPDMVGIKTADPDTAKIGVAGRIGMAMGGINAKLDVGYDTYNEEAGLRAMSNFAMGPGSLELAALYNTGANAYSETWDINDGSDYYGYTEWAVAGGYRMNVTDKLTITPQVQYSKLKTDNTLSGLDSDPDLWSGGVYFEYQVVDNLWAKLNVQYTDYNSTLKNNGKNNWDGYFRLERDF
ncbi:porin [Martelella alba]|uniref:Porin n=1 Tax=Martelella alba TaxID=2590451 RepID=A0A506UE17_9HYPH|nr:porin [Martelella alba]TPW32200.1 porin [Martelella alba]